MKQTCKTFIALVTVIVMLTGLVPLNVAAAADPSLIFEMDLSSYTNGDVSTIANSVSGGNSTITAGGSGVPELRQTTEGVPYLAFRRSDRTENLTGTSVKVVDSDIAAADALTVEAWVRAEGYNLSGKSGRIFGLGNDSGHLADVMIGTANNVYYKATGQVNTGQLGETYQTMWQGNMGAYDEEWVHYVITREWVAGENGAGTWNIAIYINGGEKKVSAAYSVASRADESDKFLMIGAHKGGTAALWGDIADFRVYNETADETKATELYNATVNNFYPGTYVPDTPDTPQDSDMIFEMDLSSYTNGDVSTIANSVSGGNSTITAGGSGVPELRQTTEGVSYLAFRRSDRTENLTGTSVKVVDSDIAAADALTVEAWVRAEGYNLSNKSGRIFGLGNDSNHFADVMIGVANNVYYKATGQVNTGQLGDAYQTLWQGDMGAYDEEWVHYVITREWVAGENGAGTWNIAIYINGGEKKVSAAYSVASRADESDKFLMIGAHKGGTAALWGDIADFRVYNEAADETKATELYNATVNNFHPGTYVPDTPDPDTPDPDTPDTPDPDTPDPDTPDTPDPDTPDTPEEPDGILIIEEDMSMYTAGTSPTETEMFVKTCKEEDNFSNLKVLETTGSTSGETINYFQLKTDVYGSLNSYYGYKFPTAATEDLVLDINLSVNGTPESRGLRCGEDTIIHNLRSAPSATKDEFGFYNLRYTFIKNTNGKYVVTCYDLLDNNKVVMTTTTSLSTIAGLYCQQYVSRGNENTSMYMDISKYKLFRYLEPEVAETNGDTLKRVDDELIVTFSQKIDEQTLGNLSIKCGDDTVVTTNKEYDASSNTLTVSLIEYLDYDKEYKICIGGIKNKYGIAAAEDAYRAFTLPDREIEANSVVFKDSQGGVIDALGTNADISATVELSSDLLSGANARVFLLLYDESGIVRDAAMAGESAVGSQAAPFTARLSGGVTPKTGYKAKCFVWQLKDGINVPVKSAELK